MTREPEGEAPDRRRATTRTVLITGSAVLVALAAAGLVLTRPDEAKTTSGPAGARLTLVAGSVRTQVDAPPRAGMALVAGTRVEVRAGAACVVIEPGVHGCLSPNSAVVLKKAASDDRRLSLERGRLVLAIVEESSAGIAVDTSAGTAFSSAGSFSVAVQTSASPLRAASGRTVVVVALEGSVAITELDAPRRTLRAGERKVLGLSAVRRASRHERSIDARLLAPLRFWRDSKTTSELRVVTDPDGGAVSIDGIELGAAPVSVLVPPDELRVRAENRGRVLERVVHTSASGGLVSFDGSSDAGVPDGAHPAER